MSSRKGAWQTLETTTVYDNPWIRVEEHQVINPSGGENLYGKVCFKNRAVAILALDTDDQIYLVGQHRYTLNEYSWELPMGGAPLTEDLLEAAQRELKEETGLTAARWEQVMRLHLSNSISDEIGVVYLAQELTQGQTEFEDTEDLSIKRLPFSEALDWVLEGRITDAPSAAGILGLWARRQRAPEESQGPSR